eukprot:scaffold310_cov168-Amphora_coffeaeformis.AAC.30
MKLFDTHHLVGPTTLYSHRQHYEKNDQMLPGKKGISLTVEQYKAFKAAMESGVIDKEIEALEK